MIVSKSIGKIILNFTFNSLDLKDEVCFLLESQSINKKNFHFNPCNGLKSMGTDCFLNQNEN